MDTVKGYMSPVDGRLIQKPTGSQCAENMWSTPL